MNLQTLLEKIKNVIAVIAIVAIAIVIFGISSPRIQYLKNNEVVVSESLYDSLIAITNRPPTIRIDTIRDTIRIPEDPIVIHFRDTVYIETTDNDSITVALDTLYSKYFDVFLFDTIFSNRTIIRSWSANVRQEIIRETIEIEKPIIQYVYTDITGFYYKFGGYYLRDGILVTAGVFYMNKNALFLGVDIGIMGMQYENNFINRPLLGITIGKKFKHVSNNSQ